MPVPLFLKRLVSRERRLAIRRVLGKAEFDEVQAVLQTLGDERKSTGVMVDVGAHFGSSLDGFARREWEVLAFEPDVDNRSVLCRMFGDYKNVMIVPSAVSDEEGQRTLYRSDMSSGISSLSAFHDSHEPGETVDVTKLSRALQEHEITHVDFLKVDTEGHDLEVLRGYPWEADSPDVIVCEFEDRKTTPLGYSYRDLGEFLVEHGYHVLMSEWFPVVQYGVEHRWRRLERFPADLEAPDGWGNFVCARESTVCDQLEAALELQARQLT